MNGHIKGRDIFSAHIILLSASKVMVIFVKVVKESVLHIVTKKATQCWNRPNVFWPYKWRRTCDSDHEMKLAKTQLKVNEIPFTMTHFHESILIQAAICLFLTSKLGRPYNTGSPKWAVYKCTVCKYMICLFVVYIFHDFFMVLMGFSWTLQSPGKHFQNMKTKKNQHLFDFHRYYSDRTNHHILTDLLGIWIAIWIL